MSEFLDRLRERTELEIAPLRKYHGDDAPLVRLGLTILSIAEEIEGEILARRVSTAEARERTGWAEETLQKYARMRIDGQQLPDAWKNLDVEETRAGYTFMLGSIPANPRRSAA